MTNSQDTKKKEYKNPVPTVDIILRHKPKSPKEILIETRGRDPFQGFYSLPGGHVDYGETVEEAALRELKEECGVKATIVGIFGVYSDPKRDPRSQRITTVFLGDYLSGEVKGGDDASFAEWTSLEKLQNPGSKIAFDHRLILSDYAKYLEDDLGNETFWSSKKRTSH